MIPEKIKHIWGALEKEYPSFLVGGAVRDIIMDREPHDFDLATLATPEQITELFQDDPKIKNIEYVGASFGVVLLDGIEVATFRGDSYGSNGDDKDVKISFVKSIEEDLARRDLTMNAMALSLDGTIIDPFGGREDIKRNVIRFVGIPEERIKEDANRIIRLCRVLGTGDFEISEETYFAVRNNLHLVEKIAPERIRAEILKAMNTKHASAFWGSLFFFGVLEIILPELHDCWFHTGGKHHIESVWEHSMLVGDKISSKNPLVKLAGYLHDIGKPSAFAMSTDGSFTGHDVIGKEIIERRLKELKFSKEEIAQVSGLCSFHMRALFDLSPRAQRKLKRDLGEAGLQWRDLVRIRIADTHGNLKNNDLSIVELKNIVIGCTKVPDVPFTVHSLGISGGDLIKEWELIPGPVVSELQKFLLDFSVEEGTNDPDCLLLKSKEFFQRGER